MVAIVLFLLQYQNHDEINIDFSTCLEFYRLTCSFLQQGLYEQIPFRSHTPFLVQYRHTLHLKDAWIYPEQRRKYCTYTDMCGDRLLV